MASDAVLFYYNLENIASNIMQRLIMLCNTMKRMKYLIIPGHDENAFSRFPAVQDRIVRIEE